ncbi:putative ATP-dependent RNA helicase YTHDC2 [Araneus ventricosus]|uniref:Putative ATP-dependent RNA helicase YTHDC2 n=1 Tax=Araneus ventricosus TaxID=182803 RepID=A0A4Y2L564_ARAVE|nr:putative ATP-dependent RNA helicase YTHDC2 [Araneus ventricosus]
MTRKNKITVGEDFRIAIHIAIKNFRQNDEQKEYEFPSSLSSTERAYVHRYCQNLGLKSKSRGEGANRFLTVYKKEGSTIVQADAVFELGHISRRHTLSLLQRFPIAARERQELLPPTERDRILGQEVRDVSRNIGRLGSGIPMVPQRKCENEFTAFRQTLPIWNCQEEIIQVISCHQVVMISGETGSGKTTQVPQFILDHCSIVGQPCRIICTQPRRIAAITVAERVALERDDKIGQSIGYQVRLESRISPKTLLTFCTNGVLLRTLMGGDASVATVTHILVDELHERDRYSDFLLIVLRDLILKFRNLKLILMSASLDMQLFCKYFSNCPIIEVPGRVFEVKTFFLEDILKGTGYTNPAMLKYIKDMEKQKSRKKLESWCSIQSSDTSVNSAEDIPSESGKNFYQDIGLENLSLHDTDSEREADPHLTATVDKVIEDAWMSGDDDFSYLMQLILSENVSVDYQHNETHVSPLMLAAGRGNIDVVEQLLVLGASIHIKSTNGWTAIDWANHFGHKEIAELLNSQCFKFLRCLRETKKKGMKSKMAANFETHYLRNY